MDGEEQKIEGLETAPEQESVPEEKKEEVEQPEAPKDKEEIVETKEEEEKKEDTTEKSSKKSKKKQEVKEETKEEEKAPEPEIPKVTVGVRVKDKRKENARFIKEVVVTESKEETETATLQTLMWHIIAPHSFIKKERVSFIYPTGGKVQEHGEEVKENLKTLNHWSKSWLDCHIRKIKLYSPHKNSVKYAKKIFYSNFFGFGGLKLWNRNNCINRAKRYCFFSKRKITRDLSLDILFRCIYNDSVKFFRRNQVKKISNKDLGSIYLEGGAQKPLSAQPSISDWKIFVNDVDLADLQDRGFDLSSCPLQFIGLNNLLPGEYLISHHNMDVFIKEVDKDPRILELQVIDQDYVVSYGMPMKFRANKSAYSNMFTSGWKMFNLWSGIKADKPVNKNLEEEKANTEESSQEEKGQNE